LEPPLEGISKVPLDKIEGTHNPTKIPSSLYPKNQREIEKRKETKAAKTQAIRVFFTKLADAIIILL
jgi:hypothetical protein